MFLGYSSLHKGFICLEPSSGRVYISRDVIFDETIFPFASMHPNAGALLRKEILLLPKNLRNADLEDVNCFAPNIANDFPNGDVSHNGQEQQDATQKKSGSTR